MTEDYQPQPAPAPPPKPEPGPRDESGDPYVAAWSTEGHAIPWARPIPGATASGSEQAWAQAAPPTAPPPYEPVSLTTRPTAPPHPMLLLSSSRAAAAADLGLVLALALGLLSPMLLAIVIAKWLAGDDGVESLYAPLTAYQSLAFCAAAGGVAWWRGQTRASLGVGSSNWWLDIPLGLATVVAVQVLVMSVMSPLAYFWPAFGEEMSRNAGQLSNIFGSWTLTQIVVAMVFVAVSEEVLFRGFVLPRLRRLIGNWPLAILATTVIFALLHLGGQVPAALLLIALFSLPLCAVTAWRRSIVPAVIAHLLFNLAQVLWIRWYLSADPQAFSSSVLVL